MYMFGFTYLWQNSFN